MYSSILILVCTAAASLLTWVGSIIYISSSYPGAPNPANYYESQLPDIHKFVDHQKEKILEPAMKTKLEKIIPTEGMDYQIINQSGHIVYGTLKKRMIDTHIQLIKKLNTQDHLDGNVIRYYPIINENQSLKGAIVLSYRISFLSANPNHKFLAALLQYGSLIAPLIYLALFTFLFGKRLGKRIEPPIASLIEGAKRIQQQDLDFTMPSIGGAKELIKLGDAFEQMRGTLYRTLIQKWRSEQERQEMVAAITHDLRTPLTIIQGHTEGLIDGGAEHPQRQKRYLNTILLNTRRSIALLEEMTELSEIEKPEFSLLSSDVDIADFVSQKDQEYSVLCKEKQMTFHSVLQDSRNHPKPMRLVAFHLSRILDNLIANSIRFTPAHGKISWHTRVSGSQVEFEIQDSGSGFSEQDLQQLFQKFYKGDPSRSVEKGHAGLGLYIARTLVEKHGGEILAENHPNGGACVRLWVKELK